MKLFLDDIRNPPDKSWVVVRTAGECLAHLKQYDITEISFDHDLGDVFPGSGYTIAKWIEEQCFYGMKCPIWHIHSANPVGRQNIEAAMTRAEMYSNVNDANICT
jgi:hypothetical protein